MSGNSNRNSASRSLAARLMDFRMVAITAGTASLANMLVPGLGSSAVGAIIGAAVALHVLKSPDV